MTGIRSVCVYCGSGAGTDPRFVDDAWTFGRLLAESGTRLVYGGGGLGLMGAVARGVLDNGGEVTGIIPSFLVRKERMLDAVQEHIVVEDMHQRKQLMFDKSDAFVAFPGGVGTLEELVEQLTWAQLGRHSKPILIANLYRYWDPLIDMLDHMRRTGFIREGLAVPYCVADSVEDIMPLLTSEAVQLAARARAMPDVPPAPIERM